MNRQTKWQALLVIGTIGCVFLLNVLFGSSALIWIATTVPILLAVANFVYGPVRDGSTDNLMLKCRRFLRATPRLEITTAIVWLILMGLGSYASVDKWKSSHLLNIAGDVEEANGSLASNASVTLTIGSHTEKVLTPEGHFSFSKINLNGNHP